MERSLTTLHHAEISRAIIGGFYDVYNQLGVGFLETVYQNALEIDLTRAGLLVVPQYPARVYFRGDPVGYFRADLMVNNCVLVELKRARRIHSRHCAQLQNVLKATDIEVGLLLNFGPKPRFKRMILMNDRKGCLKSYAPTPALTR